MYDSGHWPFSWALTSDRLVLVQYFGKPWALLSSIERNIYDDTTKNTTPNPHRFDLQWADQPSRKVLQGAGSENIRLILIVTFNFEGVRLQRITEDFYSAQRQVSGDSDASVSQWKYILVTQNCNSRITEKQHGSKKFFPVAHYKCILLLFWLM